MADEVPTGDKAVFAFLEMLALAFAFEGASAFLHGEGIARIAIAWIVSLVLFFGGIMWPRMRLRLEAWGVTARSNNPRVWLMAGVVCGVLLSIFAFRLWTNLNRSDQPVVIDKKKWDETKIETIYNQTYTDEVVHLDGRSYVDCTFNGVTFTYEGSAPASLVRFRLRNVNGHPDFGFHTKNIVVAQTLEIFKNLGALRSDLNVVYDSGTKR